MLRATVFQSARFLDLGDNLAQVCFLACIAAADDFGNLEAGPGDLRRLWRDLGADSLEAAGRVLELLKSADLLRTYESGGKRYAHIPRFRQRMRHEKHAHPRPPAALDDHENKGPADKTSDARQAAGSRTAGARQADDGLREVKRSEVKKVKSRGREARSVDNSAAAPTAGRQVQGLASSPNGHGQSNGHGHDEAAPGQAPVDLRRALANGVKPPSNWRTNADSAATYAGSLGASTMPGESLQGLVARLDRILALRGGH